MNKLIILDRDGVINFDSPDFIKSPEEWNAIPGSLEAIAKFNQAGYTVAIATNQSGIARKYFDLLTLESIHRKMHEQLAFLNAHVDKIFFCPHGPNDTCECRKPKPGLFHQISKHYNIDLAQSKVAAIGDSLRDLEAAKSAGCIPILVLTGNGQKTLASLPDELKNIAVFDTLLHATCALLSSQFCDTYF